MDNIDLYLGSIVGSFSAVSVAFCAAPTSDTIFLDREDGATGRADWSLVSSRVDIRHTASILMRKPERRSPAGPRGSGVC